MKKILIHGSGHKADSWRQTVSHMAGGEDILCPELCAAAWNALVLGIFMGGEASYTTDLGGAVLTVIFGCLAFLAASCLLIPVERLSNSPRVPKAFRGLPAQFLYISMICLALAGFAFGVPAQ